MIAGLEAAEVVVAQDVFTDTETNGYADIVLPGALWTETEGVLINSERNLTLAQPAADPPGEATADWLIIARIAQAMGYTDAFAYTRAEEIFEEIKRARNPKTGYDLSGVSYERLRETPVQWPAEPGGPDRNPIRYLGEDGRPVFPTASGRAVFFARPHLPAREMPDDDYPFALNTGRLQHQWHTLTKTGKVDKLNKLNPGPFVEIHPDDARNLGLTDGDPVEIASRRGKAVLPAVVTDRVRPGCCFAPFHWNDLFGEYLSVNAVTNDAVDPLSFQPEFKVCAVSLAKSAIPVVVTEPKARPPKARPPRSCPPSRRLRRPSARITRCSRTSSASPTSGRPSSTNTNATTWPDSSTESGRTRQGCRSCPPPHRSAASTRCGWTGSWPGGSPAPPLTRPSNRPNAPATAHPCRAA